MTNEEQIKIFNKNFRHYVDKSGKEQKQIAKELGYSYSTLNTWYRGRSMPNAAKVQTLADYFGIKKSDLLDDKFDIKDKAGISSHREYFRIPVLGRVAAGIPIDAIEEVIDWEDLPADEFHGDASDYFGLRIKGDSMTPGIYDQDTVIVHKQPDAENGEIVIAIVNGSDAVCKRLKKYAQGIMLVSTNPEYEPLVFDSNEIDDLPVRIIGKVVELRRKI